jgi:hypothetical protein
VHGVDEAGQVVAQQLAQDLVDLGREVLLRTFWPNFLLMAEKTLSMRVRFE